MGRLHWLVPLQSWSSTELHAIHIPNFLFILNWRYSLSVLNLLLMISVRGITERDRNFCVNFSCAYSWILLDTLACDDEFHTLSSHLVIICIGNQLMYFECWLPYVNMPLHMDMPGQLNYSVFSQESEKKMKYSGENKLIKRYCFNFFMSTFFYYCSLLLQGQHKYSTNVFCFFSNWE